MIVYTIRALLADYGLPHDLDENNFSCDRHAEGFINDALLQVGKRGDGVLSVPDRCQFLISNFNFST